MSPEKIAWEISVTQAHIAEGEKFLAEHGASMPSRARLVMVVAKAELEWALDMLYKALAERSL